MISKCLAHIDPERALITVFRCARLLFIVLGERSHMEEVFKLFYVTLASDIL